MGKIIHMMESLCESCEHTLICMNEDPDRPTHKCKYYLKRRGEGRWIKTASEHYVECSECGQSMYIHSIAYSFGNFCPNCGSQMEKETESKRKERAIWIPYYNGGLDRREYRCSKCWNGTQNNQDPRCLNCGSEMLREL